MRVTKMKNMEELAKFSGISRPTLSKYFHNPESVRGTTRDKIEAALERYDYRPNIYAINQNRRLTKIIGIVVPYLADPFFAEIARNIEQHCIDAGYSPTLYSSHGRPDLEIKILDDLRSMRPAGVLLAPLGRTSDKSAIERFCNDVPTVLFDSNVEGIGAAFLGHNNVQAVNTIVDYLCRTGSSPSFFEMPPLNPNANRRRNAYIRRMETLGHSPQVIRVEGESWDFENIGYTQGLKVLASKSLTTDTILCSNDRLAIGLLAAAYELGIRVGIGEDCSLRIAGHDDHPFSRFTCPSLTTIAQDYELISDRSVETLFGLIETGIENGSRTEVLFDGKLHMRASA